MDTLTDTERPVGMIKARDEEVSAARYQRWKRLAERMALAAVWLIVILVFSIAKPETFLTVANFRTIFGTQSVLAVLALALLPPLVAGDYDLSVGSMMGLSSMLIATLNVYQGWPIGFAIGAALLIAIAVGLTNGFFVVYLGVESLIATLGTATVLNGIVLWISGSATVTGVSDLLVDAVIRTRLFGVALVFYYALIIAGVMWYIFEYTTLGRRLLFVGRSRTVSRLSGINVARTRIGALVASGIIAALAGALWTGSTASADAVSSRTFLLPAFAAAFLGSTTIAPGRFNPWGTLVAVYFLVTGITGLQLLGASSFVQDLFYGSALLCGVGVSQIIAGRAPKHTT
jgi:ribose transport system permease protein